MTKRQERSRELFLSGYNCAQSVLIPFADVLGLTEEQAALVAVGFGGGMGRLRKNCGAYSAMVMLCGAFFGPDGAKAELRTEVYAQVQRVQRLFRDTFGTDQCAELLGIPSQPCPPQPEARTQSYYERRLCLRIITETCGLVEKILQETRERDVCEH